MYNWKSLASALGAQFGKAIFLAAIDEFTTGKGHDEQKSSANRKKTMRKEGRVAHTNICTNIFNYREDMDRFDVHMYSHGFVNVDKPKHTRSQIIRKWFNPKTGTTMIGHFHLN